MWVCVLFSHQLYSAMSAVSHSGVVLYDHFIKFDPLFFSLTPMSVPLIESSPFIFFTSFHFISFFFLLFPTFHLIPSPLLSIYLLEHEAKRRSEADKKYIPMKDRCG